MILLADLETPSSSRRSADRKAVFRKNRKSTYRTETAGVKAESLVPPKDPYGRTTLVSGTNLATFQYAGMYVHQPSGLNLTLFRAYDPSTARWLSRDPLKDAERRLGPNLYEYCLNDPVRYNDPDGRNPVLIVGGILILGFTAAEIYDRYTACASLSNGQTTYINTPVSRLAPFSSVPESLFNAQNGYPVPVTFRIRVHKDCNGDCQYDLVGFSLLGPGA